jgi:LysR family transcriptional regulator, hydrogen peroxide-inducible genes activator
MTMEIQQIRYFLAVARERNFSKAAVSCNVTQPALTRAIQKLEALVGGSLFDRRPGRVELTALGHSLLPKLETAYGIIADAETAAQDAVQAKKHTLRLGVMCTIGPARLVRLINALNAAVPNLELVLSEAKGHVTIDKLLADEIDVAIAGLPSYPETLTVQPLYAERYVIALPAAHRLTNQPDVRLADLDGENYLERLNCEFDDHFQAHHGTWPIDLNLKYASEREDWIQAMIAGGLGCAIVPELMQLPSTIETRLLLEPAVTRRISLISVTERALSPVADTFVRVVQAQNWGVESPAVTRP